MSVIELAEKVNVSTRSLNYYESGKLDLSTEKLKQFAKIFDCSVDYILKLTDIKNFNAHKEYNEILSKAIENGLTPKKLDALLKIWLESRV